MALRRQSLLVLVASVLVGVGNYGFSLALVWVLASGAFAVVGSANALLVIVGTAGSAVLPWLVARQVARYPAGSRERQDVVGFSLAASVVLGATTAAVVVGIASTYAPPGVLVGLAVTTIGIFVGSTGIGFLQGSGRFMLLAGVALSEVLLKVGLGAGLAAAGFGPTGAVAGSAVGAVLLAVVGVAVVRGDLAWPHLGIAPELWRQMGGIGAIQIAVSVLSTLDVVVASVVDGSSRALGSYQAMLVFARAPLFISTAVSTVVFPRLVTPGVDRTRVATSMATLYLTASCASVAIVSSLPNGLLRLLLPRDYAHSAGLLLPLALAGFGAGAVNLLTTFLQARGDFRPALRVLAISLPVLMLAEAVTARSTGHLAWVAAGGDLGVAALVLAVTARRFAAAGLVRRAGAACLLLALACGLLRLARPLPAVWVGLALAGGALAWAVSRPRRRRPGPPRVLWLPAGGRGADENPAQVHALTAALHARGVEVAAGEAQRHWQLVHAARLVRSTQPDVVVEVLGPSSTSAAGPWLVRHPSVAVIGALRPGVALPRRWVLAPYGRLVSTDDQTTEALHRHVPDLAVAGATLPAAATAPEGARPGVPPGRTAILDVHALRDVILGALEAKSP